MKKVRKLLLLSLGLAVVALIGLCSAAAAPPEEVAAAAPAEEPAADVTADGSSWGHDDKDQCSCACSPLAGAWVAQLWTDDDKVDANADAAVTADGKKDDDKDKKKPAIHTYKFLPVNDKCDRFAVNAQIVTRPKKVIFGFHEFTDLTELVGIACKTDSRKVDFTAVGYGLERTKEKDDIVFIAVVSGTVELPKDYDKDYDKDKDKESHKCKCCEKDKCKDPKCSCTTADYTAPSKHGHPGKCCCCVDGCKYADCECKSGKYPDPKDGDKDGGKDKDWDKDKDKCFEPKELCAELTAAFFEAKADKDGDGFPDKGQKPVFCIPYEAKFKRVELQPPCKPAKS